MQPYCGVDDCDCDRDRSSDCGTATSSNCKQSMPALSTMSSCQSAEKQNFNYFTGAVEPTESETEEPHHHLLQPKALKFSSGSGICGMSKAKSVKVGRQQPEGTTVRAVAAAATLH